MNLALGIALTTLVGQAKTLRVCADPDDMPMSNEAGQGMENRLAEFVAAKLGERLEYVWWAQRKSFVKHSLAQGKCDIVMGLPSSLEDADATEPYYRSSYVFVSRRDRALGITSLLDEKLRHLRIGINVVGEDYAPPALALASRGITQNIVGFGLAGAAGESDPQRAIVDAVVQGDIDVAIVWGPVAGFFAKTARVPLTIEPVAPASFDGVPFTFAISMGVQKGDEELRKELDDIIRTDSVAIGRILSDFGIAPIGR